MIVGQETALQTRLPEGHIGSRQTPPKVDRVPHILMLEGNNTRKGFFEHAEYLGLLQALPDYMKGFATFGCRTGWRHSEIARLTWTQVDREQGLVRLEVGDTKNSEGRTVYLDDELKAVIEKQWNDRKRTGRILPYVFVNEKGDDRVKRFDKAWKSPCEKAGLGVRLFHDFRRTAVRNMVRAGISERVAMILSGHKIRSVFERYNIVNDADLRKAATRQQAYLESCAGTISGTIRQFGHQKEAGCDA